MGNIKFQHIIGIMMLLIFGGLAYKFGGNWTVWIWIAMITALLIFSLALVAPDIALNLVKALPGIFGKVPVMVGKVKEVMPFVKKKNDTPESK